MQKKHILILASSLLIPALVSCNGQGGETSSSPSSSNTSAKEGSYEQFQGEMETALASKAQISSFDINLTRDLYYYSVDKQENRHTNQYKTALEGTLYSNDVATLSAAKEASRINAQDGTLEPETEGTRAYYHEYGYKYDNFIDAVYEVNGETKTLNTLRSSAKQITKEEANNHFGSGYIDLAGIESQATALLNETTFEGPLAFLEAEFFQDGVYFKDADQFVANATASKENGIWSIASYFDAKDDQEDTYRYTCAFEIEFVSSTLKSFTADIKEALLLSSGEVNENITAETSFELGIKAEAKTEAPASINFDKYFYSEYRMILGENPYSVSDASEISLGTKYFLKTIETRPATALQNIDKIRLESITKNGVAAAKTDVSYLPEDNAITFLKPGDYELNFVSLKGVTATKEVSIESNPITSLAFATPSYSYGSYCGYIGTKALVGEYEIKLEANSEKVTDDTRIELVDNTAGATIVKQNGQLTYRINATKAGSVTLNAYSDALGTEVAATKTIAFYANDDAGIASLLTESTWTPLASYSQLKTLSFVKATDTTGTWTATIYTSEVFGTYEVSEGAVILTKSPDCSANQTVVSVDVCKNNKPTIYVAFKLNASSSNSMNMEMYN